MHNNSNKDDSIIVNRAVIQIKPHISSHLESPEEIFRPASMLQNNIPLVPTAKVEEMTKEDVKIERKTSLDPALYLTK